MGAMKEIDIETSELAAELIKAASESGPEPVVFVTGNSYAPNWRWFPVMEHYYQTYSDDTACWVWEEVERKVEEANVYIGSTESGELYVVDMNRFQYRDNEFGTEDFGDDLQDEWEMYDSE